MKIVGERKTVAARLAEITGTESVYTRMPRCAYEIGPFAIELDGSVTVSESTDFTALSVLAQEGLLEGYVAPEEAQEDEEAEEEPLNAPRRRRKPLVRPRKAKAPRAVPM